MAALTVQDVVLTGLAPSMASAAGGGDTIDNATDNRTFLMVINGGGGSINVTITRQPTSVSVPGFGSIDISNTVVAVAAGATKLIGPFPPSRFNDSSGLVNVSYSGVSSVTVAALRVATPD